MNTCARTKCGVPISAKHGYYKLYNDPSSVAGYRKYCKNCGRSIRAYNREIQYEYVSKETSIPTFLVLYEGSPLVLINTTEFTLANELLDWYSEEYDFDRAKLTCCSGLQTINYTQD